MTVSGLAAVVPRGRRSCRSGSQPVGSVWGGTWPDPGPSADQVVRQQQCSLSQFSRSWILPSCVSVDRVDNG